MLCVGVTHGLIIVTHVSELVGVCEPAVHTQVMRCTCSCHSSITLPKRLAVGNTQVTAKRCSICCHIMLHMSLETSFPSSQPAACAQVKLWTVASGACYVTLAEHAAPVTGVAFLPSASALVSASLDGTLRAWDLVRYRCFRTMTTPAPVQFASLAVDPSGEARPRISSR